MFIKMEVRNLSKFFLSTKGKKRVLRNVSFSIERGQCVGVIGESGCGKSTLANCISGLLPYDEGDIIYQVEQEHILKEYHFSCLTEREKNILLRKYLQHIFQNPGGSLHPQKKISKIFNESIKDIEKLTKINNKVQMEEILDTLTLKKADLGKKSYNFSGGEKQRITIARALIVNPSLIIADEPLSSMDVTTQARILNFFKKINLSGKTILFITHDLHSAQFLCDKIIIMKDGEILEFQSTKEIFENPIHEYTKKLVSMYKKSL